MAWWTNFDAATIVGAARPHVSRHDVGARSIAPGKFPAIARAVRWLTGPQWRPFDWLPMMPRQGGLLDGNNTPGPRFDDGIVMIASRSELSRQSLPGTESC